MADPAPPSKEPRDLAEHVANAAVEAAEQHAAAGGDGLHEAVVLIRLRSDQASIAGYNAEGEMDANWLAAELAYRLQVVMEAMGKKVDFMFVDQPGQG